MKILIIPIILISSVVCNAFEEKNIIENNIENLFSSNEYIHYCHVRGSLKSEVVYSESSNTALVCDEKGLQPGEAYPMRFECHNDNDLLIRIVYSTLPKEEACAY